MAKEQIYDAIIIGGGASGLMCAGYVAQCGKSVLLLEKNEKLGKKIYITGKGRCNVSNTANFDEFLQNVVNGKKFLMSAISKLNFANLQTFFAENGLELNIERGGRAFPKSNKASDVTKALEKFCVKNGAKIKLNCQVLQINKEENFVIKTNIGQFVSHACVVATGGISYKLTGSTGDGYKFAKNFDIDVITPKPALVPICLKEDVSSLEGLSLKNVELSAYYNNKLIKKFFGECLFTKFGLSGPIALSMSSFINTINEIDKVKLYIDLKPALTNQMLDKRILSDFAEFNNKEFKNALDKLLPKRLINYVVNISKISANKKVNQISSIDRKTLIDCLKCLPFSIERLYNIDVGIITSGGVSLKELNPSTMESKKIKGLYFVGEVVDCDALTGGFNLHIAFATGYLAGNAIGGVKEECFEKG